MKFYRILENLEIDFNHLKAIAAKAKLLLIIHYFGFPQRMGEIISFCKERDILLIEDCAHALFSRLEGKYLGTFGDYGFFSLRKSLPLLDGGMVLMSDESIRPTLDNFGYIPHNNIQILSFFPLFFKYLEFKAGVTPRTFFRRFSLLRKELIEYDAKRKFKSENRILSFTFKFLKGIEENKIVVKRRKNYSYLSENIRGLGNIKPLYPLLPEGVCPLCFPVLIDDRDEVRKSLLKRGINLRAFWDILPEEVKASDYSISHHVAQKILLLPVHQSLDENHLDHILCSLRKEFY